MNVSESPLYRDMAKGRHKYKQVFLLRLLASPFGQDLHELVLTLVDIKFAGKSWHVIQSLVTQCKSMQVLLFTSNTHSIPARAVALKWLFDNLRAFAFARKLVSPLNHSKRREMVMKPSKVLCCFVRYIGD